MSPTDEGQLVVQHNHGPGLFVGGNMLGDVNIEQLDPRTRAILLKLEKDMPELAVQLGKALRDGLISPRAVAALEAARHIDTDLAQLLSAAGDKINHGVAESLAAAGRSVEAVAERVSASSTELERVAYRIESATEKLTPSRGTGPIDRLVKVLEEVNSRATGIEKVLTPPRPRYIINRKAKWIAFFRGFGTGVVVMIGLVAVIAYLAAG